MAYNWRSEYYRYKRYFFDISTIVKKPKLRSFFWLSLTLVVIAFFGLVAIRPTLITVTKLNKEIKDKQEAITKLNKKIANIVKAQELIALNSDKVSLIDRALPKESLFSQLTEELQAKGQDSGILVRTVKYVDIGQTSVEQQKSKKPLVLNFSLFGTGDYASVTNFLQKLENSGRIISLNKINIAIPNSAGEFDGQLTLVVEGTAYYTQEAIK